MFSSILAITTYFRPSHTPVENKITDYYRQTIHRKRGNSEKQYNGIYCGFAFCENFRMFTDSWYDRVDSSTDIVFDKSLFVPSTERFELFVNILVAGAKK